MPQLPLNQIIGKKRVGLAFCFPKFMPSACFPLRGHARVQTVPNAAVLGRKLPRGKVIPATGKEAVCSPFQAHPSIWEESEL